MRRPGVRGKGPARIEEVGQACGRIPYKSESAARADAVWGVIGWTEAALDPRFSGPCSGSGRDRGRGSASAGSPEGTGGSPARTDQAPKVRPMRSIASSTFSRELKAEIRK